MASETNHGFRGVPEQLGLRKERFSAIRIEQLTIRVEGGSRRQAEAMVRDALQSVASQLGSGVLGPRSDAPLQLRVVCRGRSRAARVRSLADGLLQAMGGRTSQPVMSSADDAASATGTKGVEGVMSGTQPMGPGARGGEHA